MIAKMEEDIEEDFPGQVHFADVSPGKRPPPGTEYLGGIKINMWT